MKFEITVELTPEQVIAITKILDPNGEEDVMPEDIKDWIENIIQMQIDRH